MFSIERLDSSNESFCLSCSRTSDSRRDRSHTISISLRVFLGNGNDSLRKFTRRFTFNVNSELCRTP
ncbi:unnamed protein product [Haemonchus placei]|uniref:Uncharacterized protein n=1 Tax=Haemonchus placei TaxID=6290 RepID=A0A0N4WQU5_HAEPC|nr:unnamed protein product [Haemonchus placei]